MNFYSGTVRVHIELQGTFKFPTQTINKSRFSVSVISSTNSCIGKLETSFKLVAKSTGVLNFFNDKCESLMRC